MKKKIFIYFLISCIIFCTVFGFNQRKVFAGSVAIPFTIEMILELLIGAGATYGLYEAGVNALDSTDVLANYMNDPNLYHQVESFYNAYSTEGSSALDDTGVFESNGFRVIKGGGGSEPEPDPQNPEAILSFGFSNEVLELAKANIEQYANSDSNITQDVYRSDMTDFFSDDHILTVTDHPLSDLSVVFGDEINDVLNGLDLSEHVVFAQKIGDFYYDLYIIPFGYTFTMQCYVSAKNTRIDCISSDSIVNFAYNKEFLDEDYARFKCMESVTESINNDNAFYVRVAPSLNSYGELTSFSRATYGFNDFAKHLDFSFNYSNGLEHGTYYSTRTDLWMLVDGTENPNAYIYTNLIDISKLKKNPNAEVVTPTSGDGYIDIDLTQDVFDATESNDFSQLKEVVNNASSDLKGLGEKIGEVIDTNKDFFGSAKTFFADALAELQALNSKLGLGLAEWFGNLNVWITDGVNSIVTAINELELPIPEIPPIEIPEIVLPNIEIPPIQFPDISQIFKDLFEWLFVPANAEQLITDFKDYIKAKIDDSDNILFYPGIVMTRLVDLIVNYESSDLILTFPKFEITLLSGTYTYWESQDFNVSQMFREISFDIHYYIYILSDISMLVMLVVLVNRKFKSIVRH